MKSKLILALASILAFIAVVWLSSWLSDFRANQRRILFEVWHANPWTQKTAGFYIDSYGNVYTFNTPLDNAVENFFGYRRNEGVFSFTISDLLAYYGDSSQLAGRVDRNTLKDMTSLIESASKGVVADDDPLTPGTCGNRDAGIFAFQAYLFDDKLKTHIPVYLYAMGDFQEVNLSQEGRTLYRWLETTCNKEGFLGGCNSVGFCRP